MSTFSTDRYGRRVYSGSHTQRMAFPMSIMVYDRTWGVKAMYDSGSNAMISVTFSHNEKGCASFSIDFAVYVPIAKRDIIQIFLYGEERSFFCGVVRSVPIQGSTRQQYTYSGYGLNDYFVRVNAGSISYAAKTIDYIVNDLLDTILTIKSPIKKSIDNLSFPVVTVTSFVVNYSQISDVLDAIANIASSSGDNYVYGVDSNGYFFFRPSTTTLHATLVVGKDSKYGIEQYEPEDSEEAKSKLYVLRNDGTLYTTITSSEDNDIYEEKLKGPVLSDSDLALYATGYLIKNEQEVRSAKIDWAIDEHVPDVLFADGTIRVLSSERTIDFALQGINNFGEEMFGSSLFGGEVSTAGADIDDTLQIKEIEYTFDNDGASRSISLGAIDTKLEKIIADVNKKTADLEISLGV